MNAMRRALLLLTLLLLHAAARAQAYPMTVSTTVPLPPPITWGELQDQAGSAGISIVNTGPARSATAIVSLTCAERGITIRSRPTFSPSQCIDIEPGAQNFTVEELSQRFNGSFSQSDFEFTGISFSQIRDEQMLPEGTWQICVQLLACDIADPVPLSAPFPAGCASWVVVHPQPPILTNICGTTFMLPDGVLQVAWTFSPPPSLADRISYRLDIVRIDPIDGRDGDANDAMLSATAPALFTLLTEDLFANIEIPDELLLDAGFHYAVRVSAVLNGGMASESALVRSVVCSFLYAPEGLSGNGVLRAVWPQGDDWVPFDFMNVIVAFDPLRDYTRFDYTTTMREIGGGALPDYSRTLNWPSGPPGTQRIVTFAGLTAVEAQHLSVYHTNTSLPLGSYQRGRRYRWRNVGDFTLGGTTVHGDSGEEPFGVGMGPSLPQEPANGAVVSPGEVTLRWRSANAPNEPLPPFAVVQAAGSGGPTFVEGWHHEHWLLEVSRQADFSTLHHTANGRLTDRAWTLNEAIDARGAFLSDLYKEISANLTATDSGTYFWRLHWKTDPSNTASPNYNTSEVFRFCVGRCDDAPLAGGPANGGDGDDDAPSSAGCISPCLEPLPANTTARSTLPPGTVVKLGKFQMEVMTATGSGGVFSGTGRIEVDFLNRTRILVNFSELKVNTDNQAHGGQAVARKDWEPPGLEMVSSALGAIPTLSPASLDALNAYLSYGGRLVTMAIGGQEMGLPIGIDREIDGRQVIMGVVNMVFTPTRAHLDVVAGIEVVELEATLGFGIGDVCFTPGGLGDQARAYLPYDIPITDNGTTFRFRGGASTDTTGITFVDWDCHGFKCMQLAAAIDFSRDELIPAGDTASTSERKVTASFKVKVCTNWNMLAQFTMTPFEHPQAPGWTFTVEEAWLDLSSRENPGGITFPQGYDHPAIAGGISTTNNWTGFYLKRLALGFPETIGDGTGRPVTASLNHLIIDDLGVSFNLAVANVLAWGQGNIDGWGFSLDSVYMDMRASTFRRAGLKGQLALPINGERDRLNYSAILGMEDDAFAFTLNVVLADRLTAPLFIADLTLQPNSFIRATLGSQSKVRAELNGSLGISTSRMADMGLDPSAVGASINMPGVRFERLVLDSDDGVQCTGCNFSHASGEKDLGGFPLTLRDLSLDLSNPLQPALVVEPMISLAGGNAAFAASVGLKFKTRFTVGTGGIQRFDFDGVDLTSITLDTTSVGGMVLYGRVDITRTATVEEVRGALYVALPMGIAGNLQAVFGTYRAGPTAVFDTPNWYNYWAVDGMLYLPGITLFPGVALYGFGGGAYHHMRFVDGSLPSNEQVLGATRGNAENPSSIPPQPSGARYERHFETLLGLRLGVVLGNPGAKPNTYNMDVSLRAEFSASAGLVYLGLEGNLYGLVDIPERPNANITAGFNIRYTKQSGRDVVGGNFHVMVNFYNVIRGAGNGNRMVDAQFEARPDGWFFHMGTPWNRGGLKVDLPVLQLSLTNYLMTGSEGIPAELPPPPAEIMAVLGLGGTGGGNSMESAAAINSSREPGSEEQYASGGGFAFGAAFDMSLDIDLIVLYAKLRMMLGFDINLVEVPRTMICQETGQRPGSDGWFAQGQMYAGLWGELGVQLNLLFVNFRAPILNLSAAMLVQGNLPNPFGFRGYAGVQYSVLNGAVTGSAQFRAEAGTKCTLANQGDPLAGIRMIKDLKPRGSNVSIFDFPTASYNFPLGRLLEIPKFMDRETGAVTMYRFYPYVASFTLKDLEANAMVPGENVITGANNDASYLNRVNALRARKPHEARLRVQVNEEVAPGVMRGFINPTTGLVWHEDSVVTFMTGPLPDDLPEQNVDFTYPVHRQRYFMRGESNGKGLVRMRVGIPELFATPFGGYHCTYHAIWRSLDGTETFETPISYTGGQRLDLQVPVLRPEKVYACQIVRRKGAAAGGATGGGTAAIGSGPAASAGTMTAAGSQHFSSALGSYTYNLSGGIIAQAVSMARADKLLYTFTFRTSRFSTLQEKLATLELSGTDFCDSGPNDGEARGNAQEAWDEFDIHGVWKDGERKMAPMVSYAPVISDSYYQYLNSTLYSFYSQYNTRLSFSFALSNGGTATATVPRWPPTHWLLWGSNYPGQPIFSHNSWVWPALSQDEINTAAGIAPPAAVAPGTLPGFSMPSGITLPAGGAAFGGIGGIGGGIAGILSGGNLGPSYNFRILYRAGRFAADDLTRMRVPTLNAFSRTASNGQPVGALLATYGPNVVYQSMRFIIYANAQLPRLRTNVNLPPPDEFGQSYTNLYHVRIGYTPPTYGNLNSRIDKPFRIAHEAPPAYSGSVLLY